MDNANSSRLPLILLSAVLVVLLIFLNWPKPNQSVERRARVVTVKTTNVIEAKFVDEVEALGTAKANEQVNITAQYSDLVESIHFSDGDRVKKGDILVELVKAEEQAKVKELEANLAESTAQLNRYKELLQKKVAAISELDDQKAKTDAIVARLSSAQAVLDSLTIRAPFDGQLGFRQVSVGALVRNGDVITSLDDLDTIKVDFAIPERFLPTLKIGQSIEAGNIAYNDKTFEGKVTSIASRVDPSTRTIVIRAEIPNPELKLRPGMLMTISLVRNVEQVLQLPESAVIPFEDRHFVFVVEDNVAKRKYIEVGRRKPGVVEILSGLEQDEQVVIEGALKLRDGAQVKLDNEFSGSGL
ncbi:efflux RND transporter periplasmic adaptor subunit [Thalassotalea aquiviva]|uniref:efflux RND transporter periplasmic adaptor subunit n=1 Tax=Thalassotalea aquiviva TaxID=3242415 RepID=UPI003529FD6C